MPIEMKMPRLSDTMEVGTVVKWNVKEGQSVKSGDVVADIETDKAIQELQTFDDGTVASLAVQEGESVKVGTTILLLAEAGEAADQARSTARTDRRADVAATTQPQPPKAAAQASTDAARPRHATPAAAHNDAPRAAEDGQRVFASPLARKIASESGVDLAAIEGTGPSGRIVRKDVEAAAGARPSPSAAPHQTASAPAPGRTATLPPLGATLKNSVVQLSNMRRTIARRLVESKQTVPHYQVTVSARMDALLSLRRQLNEQLEAGGMGVKLSVNDFLVRACALAMHKHPFINSRWTGAAGQEAIEQLADVNIGIAIALPAERGGGLVVATLRACDQLGLRQISTQSRQLADKARAKGLSVEEMSDSTFTISNLGMFGVEHFTAIINPPNAAILAVGAAIEQPVIETAPDGSKRLGIGHLMSMTMSSDHRIVDGAMAAQYLATVKDLLEKPAALLV